MTSAEETLAQQYSSRGWYICTQHAICKRSNEIRALRLFAADLAAAQRPGTKLLPPGREHK